MSFGVSLAIANAVAAAVNPDAAEIRVAGTAVDYTFARSFRDQIADTGSFSFSMLRADFLAASIDFDDDAIWDPCAGIGTIPVLATASLSNDS